MGNSPHFSRKLIVVYRKTLDPGSGAQPRSGRGPLRIGGWRQANTTRVRRLDIRVVFCSRNWNLPSSQLFKIGVSLTLDSRLRLFSFFHAAEVL
jgi:hypothetical protein